MLACDGLLSIGGANDVQLSGCRRDDRGHDSTDCTTPPTNYTYSFNFAIQGGSNWCTIYCSKVPQAIAQAQVDNSSGGSSVLQWTDCDVRRITYYFIPGSDDKSGLIRQDVGTTSDPSVGMLPPSGLDDYSKVIGPPGMVLAVLFEYWDGLQWNPSWNGQAQSIFATTDANSNMVGPAAGSPQSIRITLSIARPENLNVDVSDPSVRTFQHVIQIPTSSFFNSQQSIIAGTPPGTGGGGGSGGGAGGGQTP